MTGVSINGIEQLPDLRRLGNGGSIGLDHRRKRAAQIRGRITFCSAGGDSEPKYLSTALLRAMRRLVLAPSFDAPDGGKNVSRCEFAYGCEPMNGNSSVSKIHSAFAYVVAESFFC